MDTKKWYLSKTLQGQVIAAVSMAVTWFKLPVEGDEVSAGIAGIFTLVGIAYSIYGRVATKGEKLTK